MPINVYHRDGELQPAIEIKRIEKKISFAATSASHSIQVNHSKIPPDSSMAAPHRSRAVLSREKACQIFCSRGLVYCDRNGKFVQSSSNSLALAYGVSPKTIRDIWNGRTWSHITGPLVKAMMEVSARQSMLHALAAKYTHRAAKYA
jgi:hypothetical protein